MFPRWTFAYSLHVFTVCWRTRQYAFPSSSSMWEPGKGEKRPVGRPRKRAQMISHYTDMAATENGMHRLSVLYCGIAAVGAVWLWLCCMAVVVLYCCCCAACCRGAVLPLSYCFSVIAMYSNCFAAVGPWWLRPQFLICAHIAFTVLHPSFFLITASKFS